MSAQLHGVVAYVVITVRMVRGASRAMTRVIVETTLRVTHWPGSVSVNRGGLDPSVRNLAKPVFMVRGVKASKSSHYRHHSFHSFRSFHSLLWFHSFVSFYVIHSLLSFHPFHSFHSFSSVPFKFFSFISFFPFISLISYLTIGVLVSMATAVSQQLVTVSVLLAGWDAHAQRRVLLVSMATAVQSGVLVVMAVPAITWPARARVPPDGPGTAAHDGAPLVSMATSAPESVNAVETTSNIVITWLGVVVVRTVMLAWGKRTKRGLGTIENPVSLWRRAYAQNVRLRFLYQQYTKLFIFQFVFQHVWLMVVLIRQFPHLFLSDAVNPVTRDILASHVSRNVAVKMAASVYRATASVSAWQGIMGIFVNAGVLLCVTGSVVLRTARRALTVRSPLVALSLASVSVQQVTMVTTVKTAVRKGNMVWRVRRSALAKMAPTVITWMALASARKGSLGWSVTKRVPRGRSGTSASACACVKMAALVIRWTGNAVASRDIRERSAWMFAQNAGGGLNAATSATVRGTTLWSAAGIRAHASVVRDTEGSPVKRWGFLHLHEDHVNYPRNHLKSQFLSFVPEFFLLPLPSLTDVSSCF